MPVFYVDGQSQGNEQKSQPRRARVAIAYSDSSGKVDPARLKVYWRPIGDRTNNEAEYLALLEALALVGRRSHEKMGEKLLVGPDEIQVRSDSKLIVNQVNGEWKVEDPKLVELWRKARDLVGKLGSVRLEWVPREENYAGLWLEGKLKPFSLERLNE